MPSLSSPAGAAVPDRVRVLVADDHRMFRQLMEQYLAKVYEIVPGASTLPELDAAFRRGGFDVALVDLSWGHEGPVTPHLRRWYGLQPASHIVILTAIDEYFLGQSFLEGGARGFLGKRSDFAEVVSAVASVASGESYFGRDLKPPPKRAASAVGEELPVIARHILELLACGWSRKAIAKALNLSVKGVDYHIGVLRTSFGVGPWERPNWPALFARSGTDRLDGLECY